MMTTPTAGSPHGFTFDPELHLYRRADGSPVPGITGLMERAGWVDDSFFTDEGRFRGTVVHQLTLDYDLDVVTVADVQASPALQSYAGYLAGYDAVVRTLQPQWEYLEQALIRQVAPVFCGRPDRGGLVRRARSTAEIKSGGASKAHAIQTAFQAVLFADQWRIPAVSIRRYVIRLQPTGKYFVDEFTRRADFDEVFRILRKYAA